MSTDFDLQMNQAAKTLFSGSWLNGNTLGYIAANVFKATIGPSSTSSQHFKKGQSTWPANSPKTKEQKSRQQIFYDSGRVHRTINSSPQSGKVMSWGRPTDVNAKGFKKKRYVANGIWSQAITGKGKLVVVTGFSGKMKTSTAFNKLRNKMAIERDSSIKGLKGSAKRKAINRTVTAGEVHQLTARAGIRKHEAKGISGYNSKGKMVTARGADNLAYANIVQTGKFMGIEEASTGKIFDPQFVSRAIRAGAPIKGTATYGNKRRELLPYHGTDGDKIREAIAKSYADILNTFK